MMIGETVAIMRQRYQCNIANAERYAIKQIITEDIWDGNKQNQAYRELDVSIIKIT